MAPKQKRPAPYNHPPPIDSEEDEEPSHQQQEDDDDDDDDSEEEEETTSFDEQEGDGEQEKYHLSRAVKPKTDSESSDSDSESESDSDSEAPNPTPTFKVKPLASKPKEQAPKVKQPQPSSSEATQAKSASKLSAENNGRLPDPKSAKKMKVEPKDAPASDGDEGAKKSMLQLLPAESNEHGNVDERPQKNVGLYSMIRCDKVLGKYGLGEAFLRKGDRLMEASKRAEFDAKWMKLEAANLELRVKRAELFANHAKSMLQAIKSSKK